MLPFCEHCHDVVEFEERNVKKEKVIKGNQISYCGKEAYCEECGSLLFVPEVHDFNIKQMNEAYRESEDLISVEEIERITHIYNIGKRPLSKVLGWGEGTLTRYLDGDIPSKQYSQTLKGILGDPSFLKELLEENKGKISQTAYVNCKEAIESKLETEEKTSEPTAPKKIDEVVQYLLVKCVEITPLALQKLLYYSQAFSMTINEKNLFEEDCEAWVHGPVYKDIYEKYKGFGYNPIEEEFDNQKFEHLSEEEKELLDSVVNNFGCYSGKVLEEMTHNELPWKNQRRGLGKEEPSNRAVSKEAINEYFKEIKVKYNMLHTMDIKDYSKDMFEKTHFKV
ncbi:type II toxin-antitoxin system antitoxin SocA domain-containing protein [Salimicrobium sp. PL1-032A]|uniref:type II toxin-antitoxin system antitoxin SocA domain-containing protein n=1 Tax=Salimicrobium sp. PL1-032A TaxID=3095364 RepID=UPI00326176AC